jgi:hypothetical protein
MRDKGKGYSEAGRVSTSNGQGSGRVEMKTPSAHTPWLMPRATLPDTSIVFAL